MTEAILRLVGGDAPEGLPADLHPGEGDLGRLFEAVDGLIRSFADARDFVASLSEGILDVNPPPRNFLVSPFKQLHANLRHLTWQTLAVAKGDLSQKVDFLGEFSVAFNRMISALREKRILEEELKQRTADLLEANTNVMAGIQYARTIQTAFLPGEAEMAAHLGDFFVIWKPRDIIGGDLYSFKTVPGGFLLAVMDCTGHGVPGAVMTMIAGSRFDQVVQEEDSRNPGRLLERMNRVVKHSLNQHHAESPSDDGLEMGLCFVDSGSGRVAFAGARIGLYCAHAGDVREIAPDRQSIGYKSSDEHYRYTVHRIPAVSGMRFYMITDGLIGQTGGKSGLPFGRTRFLRFLEDHAGEPLARQKVLLTEILEAYRGSEPQLDDLTVVGFTIP